MKWFSDLKIRTKLLASFALVAAIAGLIGWVGLSGVSKINASSSQMYADRLVPIRDLGYANAALLISRTETRNMLLDKQIGGRQKFVDLALAESKKVDGYIDSYSKTYLTKEEQELLPKFKTAWEQYQKVREKGLTAALNGRDAAALEVFDGEAKQYMTECRQTLRALIDINARLAEGNEKDNEAAAASTKTMILVFISVGVLLAIGIGLLLARLIGKPLRTMQSAAERLAAGDVNVRVDLRHQGRTGWVGSSLPRHDRSD